MLKPQSYVFVIASEKRANVSVYVVGTAARESQLSVRSVFRQEANTVPASYGSKVFEASLITEHTKRTEKVFSILSHEGFTVTELSVDEVSSILSMFVRFVSLTLHQTTDGPAGNVCARNRHRFRQCLSRER